MKRNKPHRKIFVKGRTWNCEFSCDIYLSNYFYIFDSWKKNSYKRKDMFSSKVVGSVLSFIVVLGIYILKIERAWLQLKFKGRACTSWFA